MFTIECLSILYKDLKNDCRKARCEERTWNLSTSVNLKPRNSYGSMDGEVL